jgi:TolB-like protein
MLNRFNLKASGILLSSIAIFGLTGCGTSINLSKYKQQPLQKAKNMPSKKEMTSTELPKVIIMDLSNNKIKLASQASLGKSIATNINTNLANAKSVKLVKRVDDTSYNKILAREIKMAELGKEIDADVGQADYILTGQLSNASYDYTFQEAYTTYVKTKHGVRSIYHPPSINYKACVEGNAKIFKLPSLEEATSIPFQECSNSSEEARSALSARKRNDGLLREAGAQAADTMSYPLKNFFAKKGYIYELRKDGDDIIVKTTLGTKFGAKEGDEINIYAIEDLTNPLTNETKKTEVKIAQGTISNQLNSDYSWIIIDKIEDGKAIKAGNYVKIEYKEGLLSKTLKFIK